MPWVTLEVGGQGGIRPSTFPNASCFLVDENLGPSIAPALEKLGHARNVRATRVDGHYGEDGRQIMLTQNRDFLDDRRFPPHRHTGVIVLVGEVDEPLIKSLLSTLSLVEQGRELWEGAKVVVNDNGRIRVTSLDHKTSARHTSHYKLRVAGPPLVWVSEAVVRIA
jgi:uncharacterized protein DUF5615